MPLHRSQVFLKDTPEEIILSLQIKITPDFIKEILSYGSHVKVISPEHLAERILQEIKNTLLLYANWIKIRNFACLFFLRVGF